MSSFNDTLARFFIISFAAYLAVVASTMTVS